MVTAAVIIVLLGLNISVLGLVEVPRTALYVLWEVFVLLLAIQGVYAATVLMLQRRVR